MQRALVFGADIETGRCVGGVFLLLEELLIDGDRWYCKEVTINDRKSVLYQLGSIHNIPDYWPCHRLSSIYPFPLPRSLPDAIQICKLGLEFCFGLCARNQFCFQPRMLIRCDYLCLRRDCWLQGGCEESIEKGTNLLKVVSQICRWCYA